MPLRSVVFKIKIARQSVIYQTEFHKYQTVRSPYMWTTGWTRN